MKIVVISDSHGNIANLKHALGFAKKIKAAAIIHCGDWNNVLAVETVLDFGIPVHAVLGNADIDPQMIKIFDEKLLELKIGGRKIGIVHNVRHLTSDIKNLDIMFYGHIHRQQEMTIDGVKVVNPGALVNDISFAVYDTEKNKVDLVKI